MPASALLLQQIGTATVRLGRIEATSFSASPSSQLQRRARMGSQNSWKFGSSDDDGSSSPQSAGKGAVSSSSGGRQGVQKRVVRAQSSRKPKQQYVDRALRSSSKAVNVETESTAVTDESTDQDQVSSAFQPDVMDSGQNRYPS